MLAARSRPIAFALVALAGTTSAFAQNTVGGASFADLGSLPAGATSRIVNFGVPRGSIGVIDYDNDGFYDLFFNDNPGTSKRLFHNVPSTTVPGGREFVDVSASSGIAGDADATIRSAGTVVIFDYNNDGFDDIYTGGVTNSVGGLLFRNNGDGTFTNVSLAANIRTPQSIFPGAASAIDFNHDGFLDLFIDNTGSSRTYTLLVNNTDGTFTDRSDLVTQVGFAGTIYASAFTDLDHDGWEDRVSLLNNGVGVVLRNVPNPTGGRMYVALTSTQSGLGYLGPAPMGIAVGDYDGDGWLDLAITDAVSGTYYRNNNGVLQRTTPFATFFGWGTTWLDTTNKGRLDNYQAGSFSRSAISHLRLNNADGTWTDARDALNIPALASQYCARVDLSNDGLEDIVTINPTSFVSVFHNAAITSNHWLKIKLRGTPGNIPSTNRTNRDAVGAIVRVTANGVTQTREILAGSSYGATEDPRAHFGLGSNTIVDRIEIIWPRIGTLAERTQVFTGPITTDRIITLSTGGSCAADWNQDGVRSTADIFAYLTDWFARSPQADVNAQGGVDVQDIFAFLNSWFGAGGC